MTDLLQAVRDVDAHNAPPAQRLLAIATLFAMGREAVEQNEPAKAQYYAYEAGERLKAHIFMLRVEREHEQPVPLAHCPKCKSEQALDYSLDESRTLYCCECGTLDGEGLGEVRFVSSAEYYGWDDEDEA